MANRSRNREGARRPPVVQDEGDVRSVAVIGRRLGVDGAETKCVLTATPSSSRDAVPDVQLVHRRRNPLLPDVVHDVLGRVAEALHHIGGQGHHLLPLRHERLELHHGKIGALAESAPAHGKAREAAAHFVQLIDRQYAHGCLPLLTGKDLPMLERRSEMKGRSSGG
jgi:hypothetical protein